MLMIPVCCLLLCSCLGYESASQDPDGEDPQLDSFSQALSGHWMREHIGNCIWAEEWISFDPPDGFTATLVERNACHIEAHGVYPTQGSMQVEEGPILSWDFTTADGRREMRRFTASIINDSLNWLTFLPSNDNAYYAINRRLIEDPTGIFDQDIHIDLSFDAPLVTTDIPTSCEMTVTIAVTVDIGEEYSPESGVETFVLPCTYAPDEETGWLRLYADGFESSMYTGEWMDLFEEKGIWDKYPAYISNAMYDAFRPVLFFEPGKPQTLFHSIHFSWYGKMATPPPTSEEFWSQEPCQTGECLEVAGEYEISGDCPGIEEGTTGTITQDRCKATFEGPLTDLIGATGCSFSDHLQTSKGCYGEMTPLCRAPSYNFTCSLPDSPNEFCNVMVILIW
jgi:hypothetical protein